MMISLQKLRRVLYIKKLKKSLNIIVIYKENLFLSKLCFGATLLHDYDLQKKIQIFSESSFFRILKKCCKTYMKKHT